jgi:streptogramin lyase
MCKNHLCAIGVLLAVAVACSAQVTITEYPVTTTPNSEPGGITKGPDGNLWFTELLGNKIAKITPAGVITEFPLSAFSNDPGSCNGKTGTNCPAYITSGPDGNLWFTEFAGNKIGKITLAGVITEFPVPTPHGGPTGITSGPDGNLWFTEYDNTFGPIGKIGKITPAGVITEFTIPSSPAHPHGITTGPDGNLWFTEAGTTNNIGRITLAGVITEFPLITPDSEPRGIVTGPDGNLWFAESVSNKIGKITTLGVITEYPTAAGSGPYGITLGPDGNLWFAEADGGKIGRITTAGVITEFLPPTAASEPIEITLGPDGNLWFTEEVGNNIGRVNITIPMSKFSIQSLIISKPWFFELGSFSLGAGSPGINPVTNPVTFTFGTASIVIPTGSFQRLGSLNDFVFAGEINGVYIAAAILTPPNNAPGYDFSITAFGLDLTTQKEPILAGLQIGDNTGSTTFKAMVIP